jgi:hypothetical protein
MSMTGKQFPHFLTKALTKKEGAPVTFVPPDDPNAAGVRMVDLQRTYHMSAKNLAKKLGLSERGPSPFVAG